MPSSTVYYATALAGTAALEATMAWPLGRKTLLGIDDTLLRWFAGGRSQPLTDLFRVAQQLGSENTARALGWLTIAVLLVSRRFRHLISYLTILLTVVLASGTLSAELGRMRPTSVAILGSWRGYAHPSLAVAVFAAVMVGSLQTLIPGGRWRMRGTIVAVALVAALVLARLYLGIDHPTDDLAALGIGWAMPVIGYRWITPDESFPVRYRRGRAAHLDLTAARRAAIVAALDHQLGLHAETIEPFGLEGSAGCTPLRIRTRRPDGQAKTFFGKLYAVNHLRSDRSYKLARMILYGRLEDEKPFSTVRRLTEYEDHMLRLLRDGGLPVPEPYGFVEITPEREYLLVTDFVEDAHELGRQPVGEQEIDEALAIVRQLWTVGVAHRDIKPSNLLVTNRHVKLIDVAFATVRPTPWRQAVDLANMMLTLALAGDPELVYSRAVRMFVPDDIAEAFAACRSITVPTQLRSRLRADPRDLVGTFRRLAPHRRPVAIQLWSVRRCAVTAAVLAGALLALAGVYLYAREAGLL